MAPRKNTLSPDEQRDISIKLRELRTKVQKFEREIQCYPSHDLQNFLTVMHARALVLIGEARTLLDRTKRRHPVALLDRAGDWLSRANYLRVRLEAIADDRGFHDWARLSRKERTPDHLKWMQQAC